MTAMDETLRGRVALVTGGGSGLGRACARLLAERGASVAVNYARSAGEAAETVRELEAAGGHAVALQADIADPGAVAELVRGVERELGPVDVLVANAGTTAYIPSDQLDRITVDVWDRILRVNVVGTFLCIQAVAGSMVERGFGRVVVVSSNAAFGGAGSSIPYSVSKGALVTLTQCLARTLAPSVTVNAVAPGWMLTPWVDKHLPEDVAAKLRADPAGTTDVNEVARLVVDLAANGSVTGQAVVADAGEAG